MTFLQNERRGSHSCISHCPGNRGKGRIPPILFPQGQNRIEGCAFSTHFLIPGRQLVINLRVRHTHLCPTPQIRFPGWVSLELGKVQHAQEKRLCLFPTYTLNQKGIEGAWWEAASEWRRGEGEGALGHFSDLATLPLMTHHSPFRTLQLGSHIP